MDNKQHKKAIIETYKAMAQTMRNISKMIKEKRVGEAHLALEIGADALESRAKEIEKEE